MKVLILGGNGMLGHQLYLTLSQHFDVKVTLRNSEDYYKKFKIFNSTNSYFNVDVKNLEKLKKIIIDGAPNVVINCIGITNKNREEDIIGAIEVNALLPHHVALTCAKVNSIYIQISTDCVFLGSKGNYTEADIADAQSLYGRTKLLGETSYKNSLTIRTSIIGLELEHKHSLVEWFLSQKDQILGYDKAIFSGLTTMALSRVIKELILNSCFDMHGVWHVSSGPISKFKLLRLLGEMIQKPIEIEKDEKFICDRSLNSMRFRKQTGINIESWDNMLSELAQKIINRSLG